MIYLASIQRMDSLSHYFYGNVDEIYVVHHYKVVGRKNVFSYYGSMDAILEDNWLTDYPDIDSIQYPETYKYIDNRNKLPNIIEEIIFNNI